jgi:hypothetical protein
VNTGDEAEHVLSDLPGSTDEYDSTWNEIAHDLGQSSHPGIVITAGVKMTVSWHNVVPHSAPYFSIDPWN